eukprot:Gregarina_sp_Poly_1__679@NODE_1161_length_4897_cov_151_311801_g684_i1_p2_GENE_NODE_1161_length_4897_cov_151_311801_g684_i1NODE_1161_length_4897_cov_151_311801_g684_i1_p2_ORF_typecomplete_len335_score40_53_NODE_1161_length_4897_cov_151_311801_g684_i121823186
MRNNFSAINFFVLFFCHPKECRMDFSNILDDVDVGSKSETKCWETIRQAICVECGQPKDLILMMHPQDLKPLPFPACEPCHGDEAIDWDAHVADILNQFLELGPNAAWTEKPAVRSAILFRGGLVSQAGVLAVLRGPPRPLVEDVVLHHLISSNIDLFGKIRNAAPSDPSVLRIYEILTFCREALQRPESERLLDLARKIPLKTREAHTVVWELATQECYASSHYEDALRCLLYGMEWSLRDEILPPFEGSNVVPMSIEELLVMSFSVPTRTATGFNLARLAQRLGKPAVAALHAYRCVAARARTNWQQQASAIPMAADRKTHHTQETLIAGLD